MDRDKAFDIVIEEIGDWRQNLGEAWGTMDIDEINRCAAALYALAKTLRRVSLPPEDEE